jgi:hypothetical protein
MLVETLERATVAADALALGADRYLGKGEHPVTITAAIAATTAIEHAAAGRHG